MGSDVADINNDGRLDYMASDMAGSDALQVEKMSMGNMSGSARAIPGSSTSPRPAQYMRNAVYLNNGNGPLHGGGVTS